LAQISEKALELKKTLEAQGIAVKYDDRDTYKPGFKFADWEMKGVPIRLSLGERDLENNSIELTRRDKERGEEGAKQVFSLDEVSKHIPAILEEIQNTLFEKAKTYRDSHITKVDSYEEFKEVLDGKGGFVSAHWDGTEESEEKIKQETKATIRCIPLNAEEEDGVGIYSGQPSKRRVLFAKAY
ncbi:MAG: His/Gly/Thr/Pro-type tRNA ligase C-terminal domain-containing protein, partial [Bacteroidota bacterium]